MPFDGRRFVARPRIGSAAGSGPRGVPARFIFIIFFRNIFGLRLFGERNDWRSR